MKDFYNENGRKNPEDFLENSEPDNFDVDADDYGDGFYVSKAKPKGYSARRNTKENSGYPDNFDVDGVTDKQFSQTEEERNSNDYGDDFDSQTGEDTAEYRSRKDYGDDFSDYSNLSRNYTTPTQSKNNSDKRGRNSKTPLIFAALAGVAVFAAVLVFVLMQCKGGDKSQTETAVATTETTAEITTEEIQETEVYYEPETVIETQAYYTEAPTEELTEVPTTVYIEETTEYVEETTEEYTEEATEYIEETVAEEETVIAEETNQIV